MLTSPAHWPLAAGVDRNSGIALAWVVLVLLAAALAYSGLMIWRAAEGARVPRLPPVLTYVIPVLALVGLGIAAYLSYVELTENTAVCGPVGDCNAVQSSPYARIFGIPVGVVGLLGYSFVLIVFFWSMRPSAPGARNMPLLLFGGVLVSVLFSLYLTSIEIFVIGAVCIWCLSSAVLSGLLLAAATDPLLRSGYFDD